jgi:hypothetical protein
VLQHAAAPLARLGFGQEDSDDEIDPDETIPKMQVLKYQTLGTKTPRLDTLIPEKVVLVRRHYQESDVMKWMKCAAQGCTLTARSACAQRRRGIRAP